MFERKQFQPFEMHANFTPRGKQPFFRGRRNHLLNLVIIILVLGLMLTCLNVYELHRMKLDHEVHHKDLEKIPQMEGKSIDQTYASKTKPIVWIQGHLASNKYNWRNTYLKHVYNVFEKLGFSFGDQMSDWSVLWCHDYPFITFEKEMRSLRSHQRINHFPGSGHISNKVTLAQEDFDFIPKAFEIPAHKKEFIAYAYQHKDDKWVQKSNKHRGIEVKKPGDLNLSKEGSFIQKFVSKPFLIDGHKFDIGIYTIISSLDPVRVYYVDGDALFRFCPQVYYPFDPHILDKYVVGDDYLPLWKLPSLGDLFIENGFTFKDSFNEYLRSSGLDYRSVWEKMRLAIREVVLTKEKNLFKAVQTYSSKRNFFELLRFDFVLDENLNVFLMEANMSPNLSSDHFSQNARLYEHVIYTLLNLIGVGNMATNVNSTKLDHEDPTFVSSPDIHVFPDYCSGKACKQSCLHIECKLCKKCLTAELEKDLKIAYLEHARRGSARRIFPPPIQQSEALKWNPSSPLPEKLNLKNKLMYLWFLGKCRLDPAWCS